MGLRSIAGKMSGHQIGEPNGLMAEFFADESLSAGGLVPLVKKQVERLQNTVEARREFWSARNFEGNMGRANPLLSASEAFGNGRLGGQEGVRNFGHIESAERSQGECDLRLLRNFGMATSENHSQAVILNLVWSPMGAEIRTL